MDVEQTDLGKRTGDHPAPAVALLRVHEATVAQTRHGAADDDGIGIHA